MEGPRTGKTKLRKFAVFDIDGTIFRSSLLIEIVEELIRRGTFPRSARDLFTRARRRWLDREDGYGRYIAAVIRAFDRHVKGIRERDMVAAAERVVREHRLRVYRYTRDLARDLKRRRYYLLAITHSPKYVAGPFGKAFGFDKVYGRLLELDPHTRRFTGRTLHADVIFDKAKVLRRAMERERLTLRGSVAVGDTESDIPLLESVERPLCFNPNAVLYRTARRRGWPVVVERKDVAYRILTSGRGRAARAKAVRL